MEQVAHRVDEDSLRFLPPEREFEGVFVGGELEAVSVVWLSHRLEAFGHAFGVAVPTPGAYLRTAGDGVPRRFGPFDS